MSSAIRRVVLSLLLIGAVSVPGFASSPDGDTKMVTPVSASAVDAVQTAPPRARVAAVATASVWR